MFRSQHKEHRGEYPYNKMRWDIGYGTGASVNYLLGCGGYWRPTVRSLSARCSTTKLQPHTQSTFLVFHFLSYEIDYKWIKLWHLYFLDHDVTSHATFSLLFNENNCFHWPKALSYPVAQTSVTKGSLEIHICFSSWPDLRGFNSSIDLLYRQRTAVCHAVKLTHLSVT